MLASAFQSPFNFITFSITSLTQPFPPAKGELEIIALLPKAYIAILSFRSVISGDDAG
jgi:hypothetical protein